MSMNQSFREAGPAGRVPLGTSPAARACAPCLIDSTLREGDQRFGAYFTSEARQTVLEGLVALGVEEIEAGCAGRCTDTPALVARARELLAPHEGTRAVSVWCAAREKDLETALAMRPDRVALGLPVSDAHIEKRLRTTRKDILARLAALLRRARELGAPYVSVGLEDASRADRSFALEAARLAEREGASRVRLSDTVGVLTPGETAAMAAEFAAELSVPVAVHCHDDFGMATANAAEALAAGASFADCTLLGIGERSGVAATERLTAYLAMRRGRTYDLGCLRSLCALVAEVLGECVPAHAPVVGERIFWVESGLHADAQYKASDLYEPYDPERTGLTRRIALGKKSGAAAVRAKLCELGLDPAALGPEGLEALTETVRRRAAELGTTLDDAEVRRIATAKP
ncbi:pyruvate carboxyltransferase [Desulfovibrio sp. X2]|uniref:LeuA family protein n=1 Tax=Desulfovibrio sp. X2 TaxID=941449 RepID=UPI000358A4F3|nr:pyruvate carboxyltransferase [Desulfovibrio sp. X2]EPR42538.1 pyruvate carboxyltransferase [Desulfovibrio sp. X2]